MRKNVPIRAASPGVMWRTDAQLRKSYEYLKFLVALMLMLMLVCQDSLLGVHIMARSCCIIVPFFRHLRHLVIKWKWKMWMRPTNYSLTSGTITDLCRSKHQLIVENALLRQQLIVLRRQVNRPQLNNTDRALLVLLASRLRTWKRALLIVQPDTLLRWHRQGFRLFWKRKSKANSRQPRIPAETVELMKQMAQENRLWDAERIMGELLKLDIRVCKRTVQKYMRVARSPKPSKRKPNQNWSTFLHNHASEVWACDFLPVYDLLFRPLFIFFIIELSTRRVVHYGATRYPTDEWVAQQLREATPFGQAPRFLI